MTDAPSPALTAISGRVDDVIHRVRPLADRGVLVTGDTGNGTSVVLQRTGLVRAAGIPDPRPGAVFLFMRDRIETGEQVERPADATAGLVTAEDIVRLRTGDILVVTWP